MNTYLEDIFNLKDKVAVIIGGGGYLCSEMARGFARTGCAIAILDLRIEKALSVEAELREEGFDRSLSLAIDVAKRAQHSEDHRLPIERKAEA